MSSILTRLLEKGLPTRDVQIATTGEQQQRPLKFEGAQEGNFYNSDLLVVGGLDNSGLAHHFNLDTQGRMIITGQSSNGSGAPITPVVMEGQYPEGSNLSTNPVLLGGRYNATPRTLLDGELGAIALNSEGKMMIDLQNASLTATVNVDIDQSTDSIQLYANDGTSNKAVRTDANGRLAIVGAGAADQAVSGNPLLVAGSDGTNTRLLATDTAGRQIITGAVQEQAPVAGYPLTIGLKSATGTNLFAVGDTEGHFIINTRGYDSLTSTWRNTRLDGNGSTIIASSTAVGDSAEIFTPFVQGLVTPAGTVQTVAGDGAGRSIIVGAASAGSAADGNPILIAGKDGSNNVSTLFVNENGAITVNASQTENAANASNTVFPIGGQYDTVPRTLTAGSVGTIALNEQGHVIVDVSASSGSSAQIFGTNDGVTQRAILTDVPGHLLISGAGASGSALSGNPVLIAGSDGTNARSLNTDATGRQIMVGAASSGSAVAGNPVLNAGSDGTNAVTLRTDSTGRQIMVGAAGSGAAVAGNPVLIGGSANGNVSALNLDSSGNLLIAGPDAFQAPLTANPVPMGVKSNTGTSLYALADSEGHLVVNTRMKDLQGTYRDSLSDSSGRTIINAPTVVGDQWEQFYPFIGGLVDGSGTVQAIAGDGAGRQIMIGAASSGSAVSGNPILVAGSDGTNAVTLSTDSTGRQVMVGAAASGVAVAGNPVLNAGYDGTNTRTLVTDSTGRQVMIGAAASGTAVVGNPVLHAGSDGTNARTIATDTSGRQLTVGAVSEMSLVTGNPFLMGASTDTGRVAYVRSDNNGVMIVNARGQDDFGIAHPFRQDNNGNALFAGGLAAGSNLNDVTENPVLTGGVDGNGVVCNTKLTSDGYTIVTGSTENGGTATAAPVLTAGVDSQGLTRTVKSDSQGAILVRTDSSLSTTLHCTNAAATSSQILTSPGSTVHASTITPLLNAQLFNVVSSSAINSFALSTGCTQIVLYGIDENNSFVTETVQLDGITPVSTTNKFFAFYNAVAYDSLASNSYISVRPSTGGTLDVDYVHLSSDDLYIPILYCPVGYILRVNAGIIHTDVSSTFSLKGYNRLMGGTPKLSGTKTYWRNLYIQAYNIDFGSRGICTLEGGDYIFVSNESSLNNSNIASTLVSLYAEYRVSL